MIPEDIQNIIYKYKHQLEFHDVMIELQQKRFICKFNISFWAMRKMMFRSKDGILRKCIDLDNIDVTPFEILRVI